MFKTFPSSKTMTDLSGSVLEYCEDIITVKNLENKYVTCNSAFLKAFGISKKSDIINKSLEEILNIDPIIIETINNHTKNILTNKKTYTHTFKILIKEKEKIIKQTLIPIIENNEPKGILSISKDITSEENIKKNLIIQNNQLHTILNTLQMHVYMKDKNNNYIIGNKHAEDFVKQGKDHIKNIHLDLKEALPMINFEDKYVLENKKSITKEKLTIDHQGNEHWYSVSKTPIISNSNTAEGLITIAHNIDEKKLREKQKETYLSTLTHDLKNPLQAQISSLKMLLNGSYGELNKEQQDIINMIIESGTFMNEMLYSILTIYKYENGIVELCKDYFQFDKLINTCIKETHSLGKEKNINLEFTTNLTDIECKIFADEFQLRRVLSNLINNSINYGFRNSTITLSLSKIKNNIIFKIQNSSPEIPEEIKKQLFNKYASGAKLHKKFGVGLGLYFCKKIVEAHSGNIYLEANGTNNSFIFELPLMNETEVENTIDW
ncbi:PAS domain-containing sensor histidine kinase [bacterium]|nr:PAS domain-containing sensor histidine kinase [bacterium]